MVRDTISRKELLMAPGSVKKITLLFVFLFFGTSASRLVQAASSDLSQSQLEKLVAPVALYPDPLLAQILAASTYPLEVVDAVRFIQSNKDASAIDKQSWDPSVKAVAHYPSVLNMMNSKLDWTQQLGQAVINQQKDVMQAVQTLRKEAQNKGNLKTTPQQQVSSQGDNIQILPASTQVIYVPQYDPDVIYTQAAINPAVPFLTFGAGFMMGSFLNMGCAWGGGYIYAGGPYAWRNVNVNVNNWNHNDWNNNDWNNWNHNNNVNQWQHNNDHSGPYSGRTGEGAGGQNWSQKGGLQGNSQDLSQHLNRELSNTSDSKSFNGGGDRSFSAANDRPFSGGMDQSGQSRNDVFNGGGRDGNAAMADSSRGFDSRGGGGFGGGGFGGFHGGGRR